MEIVHHLLDQSYNNFHIQYNRSFKASVVHIYFRSETAEEEDEH